MLCQKENDQILVEILGSTDDQSRGRVVARLAFTNENFKQFVTGLVTVTEDGDRPTRTQSN